MQTIYKMSTPYLKRTHKKYRLALEQAYQIVLPTKQDERCMEMLRADLFVVECELLSRGVTVPFFFKH